MHTPTLLQSLPQPSRSAIRIGPDHGYAFDGDLVRLDAELLIPAPSALDGRDWALQLWACAAPFDGSPVAGSLVAERRLGRLDAEQPEHVSTLVPAFPPLGAGPHAMVLVLASGEAGRFDEIHDYANFPRPESFVQPRFSGSTAFELHADSVTIKAEGITNPRTDDNLSGTLALELWALAAPYLAGRPDGVLLASSELGRLTGQQAWSDIRVNAQLAASPEGNWHIALLLSEWTSAGYVTRDYANFAQPVSWPAPTAVEAPVDAQPAAAAAPAATAKKAASTKAAPNAPAAIGMAVSVNKASAVELAAVKGLPRAVAAAIVAARPFASLDELIELKGMGPKLLDKLRTSLNL